MLTRLLGEGVPGEDEMHASIDQKVSGRSRPTKAAAARWCKYRPHTRASAACGSDSRGGTGAGLGDGSE
ncbi:hypothetical protein RRG08_053168 [Elysia crispata]|uniref:Uncharacterized protein n=1 Tax=Elysia crispata TaxID=231223 RepID=A0AAE0YR02_9GAST|nr:hypothetical protein RRG08_053168 [Elysia crispata]